VILLVALPLMVGSTAQAGPPEGTASTPVVAQATGAAPPAAVAVEIQNETFLPATLTVAAGTTVTWTSRDDDPHTVTSTENVFASGGLEKDEAFSYTFTTPGTYPYLCKLHPHMTGTIIVK
jgi:plastocyanin